MRRTDPLSVARGHRQERRDGRGSCPVRQHHDEVVSGRDVVRVDLYKRVGRGRAVKVRRDRHRARAVGHAGRDDRVVSGQVVADLDRAIRRLLDVEVTVVGAKIDKLCVDRAVVLGVCDVVQGQIEPGRFRDVARLVGLSDDECIVAVIRPVNRVRDRGLGRGPGVRCRRLCVGHLAARV